MADHYEMLDVSPDATDEEIKRAYRRLARTHHPDANPDDPDAETRFKEIAAAYEVLGDHERRARYDRYGTDDPAAANPFGSGLGDIFEAFFGQGAPFGGRPDRPGRHAARTWRCSSTSSSKMWCSVPSARSRCEQRCVVRTATAPEPQAVDPRPRVTNAEGPVRYDGSASRSWARWSHRWPAFAVVEPVR